MYKIINKNVIQKVGTLYFISADPANSDYQQFIQDVAEQGIEIVTGPDIHE